MATFEEALFKLWPHGDAKIPGLRAAIVRDAPRVFEKYGINTKTAMIQFMGQISHECGAGWDVEENLNYTAKRMTQVWPSRFPNEEMALAYAHNPQALANKVYNGRMGNQMYSNDGWNYRGRGATQTTGRDGYTRLGQKLGLNLVSSPSLVNDPKWFLEAGAADFILCGCLKPALAGDTYKTTKLLNGGTVGLNERIQWVKQWSDMNIVMPTVSVSIKPVPDVVPSTPKPSPSVSAGGFWQRLLGLFIRR